MSSGLGSHSYNVVDRITTFVERIPENGDGYLCRYYVQIHISPAACSIPGRGVRVLKNAIKIPDLSSSVQAHSSSLSDTEKLKGVREISWEVAAARDCLYR